MSQLSLKRFIGKKVIEINEMFPILIFDGEESLTIECSWRLRNKETILVGSGEYGILETRKEAYNKLTDVLLESKIIDISISTSFSDINVCFENEIFLDVFCNSGAFENWTFNDGKGFVIVSLAGGGIFY